MTYTFRPRGVCSQEMRVEVDDAGIIQKMEVLGGCSGNLQGISALVVGMPAQEAIHRLKAPLPVPRAPPPRPVACGLESAWPNRNKPETGPAAPAAGPVVQSPFRDPAGDEIPWTSDEKHGKLNR